MKRLLGFSNQEARVVLFVLLGILVATGVNTVVALRKARDVQRKGDIREYTRQIEKIREEQGFLPVSSPEGLIVACDPQTNELGQVSYQPCLWQPDDPQSTKGVHYYYLSNGKRYQIFAALEGKSEAEYDPKIQGRGLPCGTKVCNFGLHSGAPLEKSIEEIENELDAKN